ncbi:PQQ-dependent sugar dehydrogenase [Actinotalea sp. C106]|uniref:PQQ-dependent sugar dehydrogenase n=1 Tax=Actinotalea sp. C106 TaxID=2908644 RepID=UPI0020289660|nr:PQQ-dependent sugar dehydrogenase [Actinotalea sp. C106]
MRGPRAGVAVALGLALTAGCGAPTPEGSTGPSLVGPTADDAGPAIPAGPTLPAATDRPQDVLTGLDAPWGLAFLPGGALLLTERDAARVLLVTETGPAHLVGPGAEELVEGTLTDGEGGLLGVAVPPDVGTQDGTTPPVLLYRTTATGNEVVRGTLDLSDPASPRLGPLEVVLDGIPAASTHNGGRLAFGPDGHLYVTTGDAAEPGTAQQPDSLAGAILRVTADGDPAPGNPDPGSPVWSRGHRNVQGIAWHEDGRMLASEFGQSDVDELNLIEAGANYGWPEVEGSGGGPGFTDPLVTWPTSEASPSGIAVTGSTVHLAALRGARLWTVDLDAPTLEPVATLEGELGRLREVVAGPDGALWVLTNNTDGRGDARAGDDRLVRLTPP